MNFSLAEAGSVQGPALGIIHEKGYRILNLSTATHSEWIAENEQRTFYASSPVALLGLIAIWEARGEKWMGTEEQSELQVRLYREADTAGAARLAQWEAEERAAQEEDA